MFIRRPVSPPTRFCLLSALSLAVAASIVGPARCQSLVTSRAALPGSDRLDWAVLGDRAARISDPFSLISPQGTGVIVSEAGHGLTDRNGGFFSTLLQAGAVEAEGTLNGNFAPGDSVLDAVDGGTVSLMFPRGVYGGGAQIAVPTPSGAGLFTVQVQAFGKGGALLASFTGSGTFSAKGDNSAPFFGIVDAAPDIYRISYTGVSPHDSLFLNRFDIATAPAAPAAGHTRLLWDNPDGRIMLWSVAQDGSYTVNDFGPYTGNAGRSAGPPSASHPSVVIPPVVIPPVNKWNATALATGPDGVSHILWNNTDGRAVLWYVNPDGTHGDGGQFGPYTDAGGTWRATAVSVGSDGLPHLLWVNPDGREVLWDGHADGTYTDHGQHGPYTDAGGIWRATALSVGPDNLPHLLWTNPDGREVLWDGHANGTYIDHGQYGPYTDAGGTWRATALSVGPDALPHLLWASPDGRAVLWDGHADGTYTDHGQYGPYTDGGGTWRATSLSVGQDDLPYLLWTNPDGREVLWDGHTDGTYGDHGQHGPYTDAGGTWRVVAASAGP